MTAKRMIQVDRFVGMQKVCEGRVKDLEIEKNSGVPSATRLTAKSKGGRESLDQQSESRALPEVLQIRCPSCTKLYEVHSKDVRGRQPQFECVLCHCRFSFSFPPAQPDDIQCKILSHSHMKRALESKTLNGSESAYLKTCPKCAALNPLRSLECYSCGVIFSRVEGMPREAHLRAQPSLLKKWKSILNDYENQELHEEFLQSCIAVQALDFARDRYQEAIAMQGIDPIGEQMVRRVDGLKNETKEPSNKSNLLQGSLLHNLLMRYWRAFPLALGVIFVFIGLIGKTNRNMVGVGITLLLLSVGFVYIMNGRVKWNDFIR